MPRLAPLALALCLALVPRSTVAQEDLARCQAATPQFPQACACVIDRAQAAGITGPTLSRLLSNDTGGLPIETFQRYGAIYVQCIQEAVLAGVPAAPTMPVPAPPSGMPAIPSPPVPAAPAPAAPVPVAPPAVAPAPGLDVLAGGNATGGDAPRLRIADGQAPGQWGGVVMDHRFGGRLLHGTQDMQGRIVAALCAFDRSVLMLAGAGVRSATPRVEVTALAGSGDVIARRVVPGLSLDGDRIVMPMFSDLETGIRRGAVLRLAVAGGPQVEVGLGGSNAALGPGRCGFERLAFDRYLVSDYDRPAGVWRRVEGRLADLAGPYLEHEAQAPFVPTLALSCDRRLIVRSPVFGYGGPGEMVLTPGAAPVPLDWQAQGGGLASGPLSDDLIAALAAAQEMTLTVYVDVEPGEFTTATYPMTGFSDALAGLACPAPPPPVSETARRDLTGLGLVWLPGDIGPALPPAADGTPARFPIASLDSPADLPRLSIGCDGVPFFAGGDWNIITGDLRLTIDGDPAMRFDQFYGNYRSFLNPGGFPIDMTPRILDGGTLRVMSVDDPGLDILFPLDGLAEALGAAGCPS